MAHLYVDKRTYPKNIGCGGLCPPYVNLVHHRRYRFAALTEKWMRARRGSFQMSFGTWLRVNAKRLAQIFLDARGAGNFQPDRAVVGFDNDLERKGRTTLSFE